MVRCKFKCDSKTVDGNGDAQIAMSPVYGDNPENKEFFRYTPCGNFTFGTINKAAADQIEQGKEYYIDITLAE